MPRMTRLATLILSAFMASSVAIAEPAGESVRDRAQNLAARWLEENTDFVSCDERHFIYGVAYIDGSYMERIFYVKSERNTPILTVSFRDSDTSIITSEQSFSSIPFVLEMKVPAAKSAVPGKGSWRLVDNSWESALRFKYTSWYGSISHQDGKWNVTWEGYRRPMLPRDVTGRISELCELFSDY